MRFLAFAALVSLPVVGRAQQPTDYPDVLDLRGTPESPEDRSVSLMSDLGAWHGHSLPGSVGDAGGFPGPFLMESSSWMGAGLAVLRVAVVDEDGDREVDFGAAGDAVFASYPGRLHQRIGTDRLTVELDLVFVSPRSSLLRSQITNSSGEPVTLRIGWQGTAFEGWDLQLEWGGLVATHEEHDSFGVVTLSGEGRGTVSCDSAGCREYLWNRTGTIDLAPGQTTDLYAVQSVYLDPAERSLDRSAVAAALRDPATVFRANLTRWSGYLSAALSVDTEWSRDDAYRRVAVKAVETLINNWRSASADLEHDGLFPSYAASYFNGFWAWDSWKHAVALAQFAPGLARDQIRAMFDYQNDDGMIADVIYRDASENNWRDTKPPLAAWAVWEVYQRTGDRDFLEEMLPQLLRYHDWWYTYRDHDGDGLAEYGSTDGTIVAARWESGMDNAVRFDSTAMLPNGANAWSMDQESVDLNSYLYADKLFLARIADAMDLPDLAIRLRSLAAALRASIRTQMFDNATGFFYDIAVLQGAPVRVQGPEGWIPLWAGVATMDEAGKVRDIMIDPARFATLMPFPTLAADHPDFTPDGGYWRGPVWLDQAYFGVRALQHYGFESDARSATRRLFVNAAGLLNAPGPIHENYHPLTGAALEAGHFSWSAAHYLLLFMGR